MTHPFTLFMATVPRDVADQTPLMSIYDGALLEEASRQEVFVRIETDGSIMLVGWKQRVEACLEFFGLSDRDLGDPEVPAVIEFVPPDYMPSGGN